MLGAEYNDPNPAFEESSPVAYDIDKYIITILSTKCYPVTEIYTKNSWNKGKKLILLEGVGEFFNCHNSSKPIYHAKFP